MIDEIMEKEITRKEFILKSGILILTLAIFPSIISEVFKEKEEIRLLDKKIYLNEEQIGEIR